MKEIGGYLEIDRSIGKEYYDSLASFNTACNALIYVIRAKRINKIFIPKYMCDSLEKKLFDYHVNYEFYKISDDLLPIFNTKLKKDEYIYIVNYFGQISNYKIKQLKEKYKNVIIDNVHAFFQKPIDGICTIYSCRKFFGVPDGAYLSINNHRLTKLNIDNSCNRIEHIFGRYDKNAASYYNKYKCNEKNLEKLEPRYMSTLTKYMLSNIDYETIKKIRTRNYKILKENLDNINKIKTKNISGAYCYPLYIDDGEDLRKELIKNNIYIATLWPHLLNKKGSENDMAKNILPIPCDQRYDKKDMSNIIKVIKKYR